MVIDTNVFVSAILSPDGEAREVLRRCLAGRARPLVSNALYLEYEDVLARDDLFPAESISTGDRKELLDAVLSTCEWVSVSFLWRPNLPDESDNHLIELAIAGNADSIITRNTKDIATGELIFDGINIVTPADWPKDND